MQGEDGAFGIIKSLETWVEHREDGEDAEVEWMRYGAHGWSSWRGKLSSSRRSATGWSSEEEPLRGDLVRPHIPPQNLQPFVDSQTLPDLPAKPQIPALLGSLLSGSAPAEGKQRAGGILIRAPAGTGKTWAIQQLAFLAAQRLLQAEVAPADAPCVGIIPVTVYIQKFVRLPGLTALITSVSTAAPADQATAPVDPEAQPAGTKADDQMEQPAAPTGGAWTESWWRRGVGAALFEYMAKEYGREAFESLLLQTPPDRLLVLLDGVDEAAGLRRDVTNFAVSLARAGARVLVTSRPEGVDIFDFRDFAILALNPLDDAMQLSLLQHQLADSPFCTHLMAFSKIRRDHDEIYGRELDSGTRGMIEEMGVPDRFKKRLEAGGLETAYDGDMRQKTKDGSRLVARRGAAEPRSRYLTELDRSLQPLIPLARDELNCLGSAVDDRHRR